MNPSIFSPKLAAIPASQVVVIAGSPGYLVGPLGRPEAHDACVANDPNFIGYAAVDAGLCQIDPGSPRYQPIFLDGNHPIALADIESRWGSALRANVGIRLYADGQLADHVENRIGAPLAHGLERGGQPGGLRYFAGLTADEIAASPLAAIAPNFTDEPDLKPDLVSDMVFVSLAMAMASWGRPLSELVPDARHFRVWASSCIPGLDAYAAMGKVVEDDGARRLAAFLTSHAPNLFTMALSPYLPLDVAKKNPDLVEALLRGGTGLYNVPQTPLVSSDACASALVNFCNGVNGLLTSDSLDRVDVALWGAGDAPLRGDGRVNEGFKAALVSDKHRAKRDIPPRESLRPFDRNMLGSVAGHLGGAFCATTLEFAMRKFLNVVALVPGWGQSTESGGKGHLGGVGYCGGNATRVALLRAYRDHGFGVNNFEYWVSHGTGTLVNSLTDLSVMQASLRAMAAHQGIGELNSMFVGAIKALIGHSFGAAGIPQVREAIKFVKGDLACGIPNFVKPHPKIPPEALAGFVLNPGPHRRQNLQTGAITAVQGFGGPNGAMAFYTADPETVSRYATDAGVRAAYLERWSEIRRDSEAREARAFRTQGAALAELVRHRWAGQS